MKMTLLNKILSFRASAIVLLLGLSSNFASAQCTFSGQYWTSYTPACTGSAETITTCAWGGDYMNIDVVAGQTYTFSTCGASYDTQLTLFTNSGATYIAYNDDDCGLQSTITWTATFTGTVQLQLNNYYCNTGTTCTTVTVACSGSGGGGSGPCASTNTVIGCGTSQGTTLTGTGSWNFSPCGFSTPGVESIWEFTPTTSGIHSLVIQSITGGWVDFAWAPASGGCGPAPGVTWNCISDVLSPGSYGTMNWVAGQTYYILIDPETTATTDMTWYVDCPNPSGYPSGDCAGAIPICSNANFAIDPSGYGTIDELCTYCTSNPGSNPQGVNSGCLLSGELNSTWMTISVAQGGTLEFSFGAPGGGVCFDWAMWAYNPASTCNNIYNNTQAPVSCNWNGTCDGFTGMTNNVPAGGYANDFQPTLNVNTGDQFVIMLSNYSSAYTNVPLNFFGTADISCTPLPVEMINFVGENSGNFNVLNWSTASEFHNSHFDIERSVDGQSFSKIGEVKGIGTSMELNSYRFVDSDLKENMYYYRLKQVDVDGAYKYSNTIAIATTGENHFKVVSTYPNPAKDVFYIDIFMDQDDEIQLSLIESNGKVVYSENKQFNKGNNHISVPVSEFAQGMYMLNVYNERTDSKEIIKLAID